MMQTATVGARQIKAARALLNWSQEELAAASELSIATIRKLELGHISPRHSTNCVIRQAFENAGLEFIDPDGIRRRPEEMAIYRGSDGVAAFMNDIRQTARAKNGEDIVVTAPEILFKDEGFRSDNGFDDIFDARGAANIKCLLTKTIELPPSMLCFEFRLISKHYIDPIPFMIYGDKYALIVSDAHASIKIVVIQSAAIAQTSRRHFLSMWDKALPLCLYAEATTARLFTASGHS